jgi:hypothetical protein
MLHATLKIEDKVQRTGKSYKNINKIIVQMLSHELNTKTLSKVKKIIW